MNKTLKYILIGIAVFLAGILFAMLLMHFVGADEMNWNNDQMGTKVSSGINGPKTVATTSTVGYKNISTKKLAVMIKNKDFTLVNVHTPYIGDIKGTDLSIPFNTIAKNLDKLPKDKTAKIVLYCQSGNMSVEAADTLSKLGYSNVYSVNGGMIQWQKDGNTLIKK